jgi:hypothetical protein
MLARKNKYKQRVEGRWTIASQPTRLRCEYAAALERQNACPVPDSNVQPGEGSHRPVGRLLLDAAAVVLQQMSPFQGK